MKNVVKEINAPNAMIYIYNQVKHIVHIVVEILNVIFMNFVIKQNSWLV